MDSWFADTVYVHHSVHRRYAHRLTGSAEGGEELMQEAYARLFALTDWASIANPHAFTMRIIHNLAVERLRHAEVVHLDRGIAL